MTRVVANVFCKVSLVLLGGYRVSWVFDRALTAASEGSVSICVCSCCKLAAVSRVSLGGAAEVVLVTHECFVGQGSTRPVCSEHFHTLSPVRCLNGPPLHLTRS